MLLPFHCKQSLSHKKKTNSTLAIIFLCVSGKSLFNDFLVKLVLLSNVCANFPGDPGHTHPTFQNKEGQNSQVFCLSKCLKAKCVILVT